MYATSIGRIGALAVALGVGAAALSTPAISWAEPSDTDSAGSVSQASTDASPGAASSTSPGTSPGRADATAGDSDVATADAPSAEDGASTAVTRRPGAARQPATVADDIDESDLSDDEAAGPTETVAADTKDKTGPSSARDDEEIAAVGRGGRSVSPGHDTGDDPVLDDTSVPAADAEAAPLAIARTTARPTAPSSAAPAASGVSTVAVSAAVADAPAPSALDVPGMVVQVATELVSAALAPFVATGLPGAPGPTSALWMMLGWVRREFERSVVATVAGVQQVSLVTPATLNPFSWLTTWIQQTFLNSPPSFPAQTVEINLAEAEVSRSITLAGLDAYGEPLTYSINGAASGTGTAGGTLTISGGTATYTPPSSWDGTTPYQDVFNVTGSDAGAGLHIHGLPGLLNLITFGLFGNSGHTATASLTVKVSPIETGSFPVLLVNDTNGLYSDDEIFVWVVGQATPGQWSWVDRNGKVQPLDPTQPSSNMTFSLADAGNLRIPPELQGGRIYISKGQALHIVVTGTNGWSVPDVPSPGEPNYLVPFQYFELTYKHQSIHFGGDPSYIPQTSVVLVSRLEQESSNTDSLGGIPGKTIAEVIAGYEALPPAWQGLVVRDQDRVVRIVGPQMAQPGALATWMDPAVEAFWTKYKNEPFSWDESATTAWKVEGNVVTENGVDVFKFKVTHIHTGVVEEWTISRPTSKDIFESSGTFVTDLTHPLAGAFLAQLNGAFNRGVATEPTSWWTPSAYYQSGSVHNNYAAYLHSIAEGGLLYAFPYDDTNNQSGVQILNNADPPDRLTITIR